MGLIAVWEPPLRSAMLSIMVTDRRLPKEVQMEALIVVDAQNEFSARGLRPVPNHEAALAAIHELVAQARRERRPIAWVRHLNRLEEWPAFEPGSWGAELSPGLGPQAGAGPEALFGTGGRARASRGRGDRPILEGLVLLCQISSALPPGYQGPGGRGTARKRRGFPQCATGGALTVFPPPRVQASSPPSRHATWGKPFACSSSTARALVCSEGHVQ